MINVVDYIKIILQKKKWTQVRLCEEINKIEAKLGTSRTTPQNISNYMHGQWDFRPKVLAKYEKALGLPQFTLINLVPMPSSKEGKKELEDVINKLNNI